jgi:hypothetical protein
MLPDLDKLQETQANQDPTEVRIILQKFGGKVKVQDNGSFPDKLKKGGAKGYMEYVDVTDEIDPKLLAEVKEYFFKRTLDFMAPKK